MEVVAVHEAPEDPHPFLPTFPVEPGNTECGVEATIRSWHRSAPPPILEPPGQPESGGYGSFRQGEDLVALLVVFFSAGVVGLALAGMGLWLISVGRRGCSCPRCASPTFLLAVPLPLRWVGHRVSERWCPGCGWRGLAIRHPPRSEGQPRRSPGIARWSSERPSLPNPPGWVAQRQRPTSAPSPPIQKGGPDPAPKSDHEPLPHPFRSGSAPSVQASSVVLPHPYRPGSKGLPHSPRREGGRRSGPSFRWWADPPTRTAPPQNHVLGKETPWEHPRPVWSWGNPSDPVVVW